MQNFWWLIVLYLCILKNATDALNVTQKHSLPGDQSAEPGRRALSRENSGDLGNDLGLELTQNNTDNSRGTDTHGTRVRRSSSSSGECAVSKDDLHGLYSAVHEILLVKTQVNKIPSFLDYDCSVGFQNIMSTARDLNREVTTLSTSQEMQNKDYDSLKNQYEQAAKEMQDQINELQNRQDESTPELEGILAKLKELSRQKEEAEAEKKILTDFQEKRLGWQQDLRSDERSSSLSKEDEDMDAWFSLHEFRRFFSTSSNRKRREFLQIYRASSNRKRREFVRKFLAAYTNRERRELLRIFLRSSNRKRRDLNGLFLVPTICRIRPQQLSELQTHLQSSSQKIWSQVLPDSATAQPQPLPTSDTSCDHRTQSLRSKLLELKDNFNFYVRNANTFNLQRKESLTRSHEEQIAVLTKRKDDLTQSIGQKRARNSDTHQSILQNRQEEVNAIRTENKQLHTSEKRAAIELVAALIRCKENTWAVVVLVLERISIHFGPPNAPLSASASEQLIKEVVGSAYNKSISNLEKVLDFANQLPKINEVITANEAIYEEMRNQGHLTSPHILVLAHQVDGVIHSPERAKGARGRSEKDRLRSLESKLTESVTRVLSIWANNINSQDTNHIASFPQLSVKTANGFNHYLPRLVQTAYNAGRLSSVEKLLKFSYTLHWYSHLGTVMSQLFQAMKRHGDIARHSEISLLAYAVKKALEKPNEDHVMEESRHLFQGVKDGLPSSIRALVWERRVKVWNEHRSGYTLYGSKHGNIYTYPDDNYEDGENQRWDVSTWGDGRSFSFCNQANALVLYSDSKGHAYSRAAQIDMNERWEILPATNGGDSVYIRNRETRGFLYAGARQCCQSSRLCCCSTASAYHTDLNSLDTAFRMWQIT